MKRRTAWLSLALSAAALLAVLAPAPAAADEGWVVRSFQARIDVRPDSSLDVVETIDADFGSLQKHGIFRDIPVQYDHDAKNYRVYRLQVLSVKDGSGRSWPYSSTRKGAALEIKIGDPNRTVSGRQAYVIHYTVQGALNAFADHDELYWNVNGGLWPVPMESVQATVSVPSGAFQRATCYEGLEGSTEPCTLRTNASGATYAASRPLPTGQQLTVVAALAKGAVSEPPVFLERKPRTLPEYFDLTPVSIGVSLLLFVLGLAWLGRLYLLHGRDRVYKAVYNTGQAAPEEIEPLLGSHAPVVVEFEPPEGLRPAQMGLLIHESADMKGVTATIVDLATRGYLRITELEEPGLFGHHRDWKLSRLRDATGLLPYESAVFLGLFGDAQEVKLSELRGKFAPKLDAAREALYTDSVRQRWFGANPRLIRGLWLVGGIVLATAGVILTIGLGIAVGLGLIGLAVILLGLAVVALHRVMPQKTARGHELLRRTLGFNQYIYTAERYQQQMAEREKIFTAYLPYAIVFGCVTRWAAAFKDIDQAAATSGWYTGPGPFTSALFYSSLMDFSTQLGPALAYTPPSTGGGMGGSGFGGGAGGGGGGGGGGSW